MGGPWAPHRGTQGHPGVPDHSGLHLSEHLTEFPEREDSARHTSPQALLSRLFHGTLPPDPVTHGESRGHPARSKGSKWARRQGR